jgi:hypothetical protein
VLPTRRGLYPSPFRLTARAEPSDLFICSSEKARATLDCSIDSSINASAPLASTFLPLRAIHRTGILSYPQAAPDRHRSLPRSCLYLHPVGPRTGGRPPKPNPRPTVKKCRSPGPGLKKPSLYETRRGSSQSQLHPRSTSALLALAPGEQVGRPREVVAASSRGDCYQWECDPTFIEQSSGASTPSVMVRGPVSGTS